MVGIAVAELAVLVVGLCAVELWLSWSWGRDVERWRKNPRIEREP